MTIATSRIQDHTARHDATVDRRWRPPLTVALAALAAPVVLWLYFGHESFFDRLTREDGVVEYGTAVSYLVGALVLGVIAARRDRRNVWLWGLAVLFFVVAGEEVSWGQRFLGVETPGGLAERNVQGETNLHNIGGIHGSVRAISLLVLWGLFVALPGLVRGVPALRDLARRWRVPVPSLWSVVLAVIATGFMVGPRMAGDIVFSLDEVGEFYFGILAAWFAVVVATAGIGPGTAWYPRR